MSKDITPLQVAERLLNGLENVAIAAGRHEKAAYPWRYANGSRGAGDFPSASVIRLLHQRLTSDGYPLTCEPLLYGATEEEVEAIIAARTPTQLASQEPKEPKAA